MAFQEIPSHPSPHRTLTRGSESLGRLPRAGHSVLERGVLSSDPPPSQQGGLHHSLGTCLASSWPEQQSPESCSPLIEHRVAIESTPPEAHGATAEKTETVRWLFC